MDFRERLDSFLDTPVFSIGEATLTIGTVGLLLAIVAVSYWLSRLTRKAVARAFLSRITTDEQAVNIYSRLVGALVFLLGLAFALRTAGLQLTAVFAAGGVFAVAIGFAAQPLISNFVSGAVLRFEGAIKLGDVLEVGGRMVKIHRMMLRAMVARDLDEQDVVIPNSELAQTTVTNYTLRDRKYRLRTTVGVLYSSDMRKVRETLEEAARGVEWRSPEHDPVVLLRTFGNSSVNFEVSVWIGDPWLHQRRRSNLNETLWWALKAEGIVIAFPQLDVHLDPQVVRALERSEGS